MNTPQIFATVAQAVPVVLIVYVVIRNWKFIKTEF